MHDDAVSLFFENLNKISMRLFCREMENFRAELRNSGVSLRPHEKKKKELKSRYEQTGTRILLDIKDYLWGFHTILTSKNFQGEVKEDRLFVSTLLTCPIGSETSIS